MGNPSDYTGAAGHGPPFPGPQAPFPGAPLPYGGGPSREAIIDDEHLRLLRIGYFVSAGQTAVFIPLGLFYAAMGVLIPRLPGAGAPPPPFMSLFFGIFGTVITGIAVVATGLKLFTAIRLKERRSRTLCMITAALTCLEIPYGTALGIMTLVVLGRASVQREFERHG
jgi:hypothetical protein